ncbi:hypothetical protein NQ315_008846 [Exocentrus adspersus]|uniref:RNA helicase n=1 Tax=Exocentrus adspersus TaxID=1586481 RepID=A0AAV8VDJ5_9CUCU|nr:hypothetical protein NQ315_008846 [Exocentrus adspersus]
MSARIVRFNKLLKFNSECGVNFYSTSPKFNKKSGQLVISCKRKNLNFYSCMHYGQLDDVPLASKGWNHSKSKGDFFTVLPILDGLPEETCSFKDCGLNDELINALNAQGINKATEFQFRAISTIESGNHVMLAAETGCGKTISYLLPIIKNLVANEATNLNTPRAVVFVPNRELAHQVGQVAEALATSVGLTVKVVTGGRTKKIMMNPEFEKIDLLVATPGALGKLSTVGVYRLNEVLHTVLDEADTLIDDSFIDRMEVSATLPRKLPDILCPIESTLQHVVSPKIHKPLQNITQKFFRLTKSVKPSHLLQIAKNNNSPLLIFTNKNQTCNWLAIFLRENGVTCANINGDMNYHIRIDQWNQFVRGEAQILSATDVGSRGLNTVQVKHVLNYDFPLYAADYIHRIGRVGRLGSSADCKVTNFVSGPEEILLVQQIEMAIRKNQQLSNVDGNITNIVQKKIASKMRETA